MYRKGAYLQTRGMWQSSAVMCVCLCVYFWMRVYILLSKPVNLKVMIKTLLQTKPCVYLVNPGDEVVKGPNRKEVRTGVCACICLCVCVLVCV